MWGSNQTFKPKKNYIRGPRPKPKIESNLNEWSHIWERREDTKTNQKMITLKIVCVIILISKFDERGKFWKKN